MGANSAGFISNIFLNEFLKKCLFSIGLFAKGSNHVMAYVLLLGKCCRVSQKEKSVSHLLLLSFILLSIIGTKRLPSSE